MLKFIYSKYNSKDNLVLTFTNEPDILIPINIDIEGRWNFLYHSFNKINNQRSVILKLNNKEIIKSVNIQSPIVKNYENIKIKMGPYLDRINFNGLITQIKLIYGSGAYVDQFNNLISELFDFTPPKIPSKIN